ncbi:MAG: tRNA (adenine-N1)-methyltransferase [Arcanobacterium sp.]|nr:tRNA (adenine-N1)-methyltransferase [Arcanobacterium sp.]
MWSVNNTYPHPLGPDRRRGVFRAGERVQLTDTKGRKYTVTLAENGFFQSTRGNIRHSEIIGKPEGSVLETQEGHRLLALRPLISDYVLSMPRGATVVYPKDAGQIIHQADIFPGARVVEAGVGSGALTLSLLSAVGPEGSLISVERREEFAEIAIGNVESWFGPQIPDWEVRLGDLADVLESLEQGSIDRVVLDMLAPWENIYAAAHALAPGGVILAYVATTTQMSRFVEELRDSEMFTEPEANETMLRTWHLDGLAVRPDHRMVAHTGFLVHARRLAPDAKPLVLKKRPAPAAHSEPLAWENSELAERPISVKKLRKVRRDVALRADVEATGKLEPGSRAAEIREKLDSEAAQAQELRYAQRRAERENNAVNDSSAENENTVGE